MRVICATEEDIKSDMTYCINGEHYVSYAPTNKELIDILKKSLKDLENGNTDSLVALREASEWLDDKIYEYEKKYFMLTLKNEKKLINDLAFENILRRYNSNKG